MSFIAERIGKKVFAEHAKTLEPADPHYETFTDGRGRTRSRKRKLPEGLSKNDARILRSVRRRAHYLDKGFSLCGFRFGWTAIFGLIPIAGDVVAFLLSYLLVIRKARQANLPLIIQQRMAFNQAVSVGAGMIPLVGDIILAVWKANSRNAALLEEFLIQRAATINHTAAAEDAAANVALQNASIESRSGEKVGKTAYVFSDDEDTADESLQPQAVRGKRSVPKEQKNWYGWGSGGTTPAAGGVGPEGSTSALIDGQGLSSGTTFGRGNGDLKKRI